MAKKLVAYFTASGGELEAGPDAERPIGRGRAQGLGGGTITAEGVGGRKPPALFWHSRKIPQMRCAMRAKICYNKREL